MTDTQTTQHGTIMHGDCLEKMKEIPDGSVDLILCDLPYGTMMGCDKLSKDAFSWDKTIDTAKLFEQYERVLRMNGVAILFSQEPYTSHLRTFKSENFNFHYPMIWEKDNFGNALSCNKAPVSYFEDLNVFSKRYDKQAAHPLRKYFREVMEYTGKTRKDIISVIGQRADHVFRTNTSQFALCTREVYDELIAVFNIDKMDGFMAYDDMSVIDRAFKDMFSRTFNLPENKKVVPNVLKYKKDYQGLHPTQKPVALLEYLIKTYSNPGDLVVDNCMGSGSTCVACVNTDRRFIGIELDPTYYSIAATRIADAEKTAAGKKAESESA